MLVRNGLDANIDMDRICTVFYQKGQGENASKLSVLYKIHFTPAAERKVISSKEISDSLERC